MTSPLGPCRLWKIVQQSSLQVTTRSTRIQPAERSHENWCPRRAVPDIQTADHDTFLPSTHIPRWSDGACLLSVNNVPDKWGCELAYVWMCGRFQPLHCHLLHLHHENGLVVVNYMQGQTDDGERRHQYAYTDPEGPGCSLKCK